MEPIPSKGIDKVPKYPLPTAHAHLAIKEINSTAFAVLVQELMDLDFLKKLLKWFI